FVDAADKRADFFDILFVFGAEDLFKNFQHVQAFVLSKVSDSLLCGEAGVFLLRFLRYVQLMLKVLN
ncbi:MAG: hypothetical protein WBP54_09165, partial [Pelodictyon phaeoclathratiforme]